MKEPSSGHRAAALLSLHIVPKSSPNPIRTAHRPGLLPGSPGGPPGRDGLRCVAGIGKGKGSLGPFGGAL